MKTVNIELLKSLAHSTPTAETCFLVWNERQRARRSTTLRRFKKHLKHVHKAEVDDKQLEDLFFELTRAGVGIAEQGRNGAIRKFYWNYSMQSIAKAAMGGSVELESFTPMRPRIPQLTVTKSVTPGLTRARPQLKASQSKSPSSQFKSNGKVEVYVIKNNQTLVLHLEPSEAKLFATLMEDKVG